MLFESRDKLQEGQEGREGQQNPKAKGPKSNEMPGRTGTLPWTSFYGGRNHTLWYGHGVTLLLRDQVNLFQQLASCAFRVSLLQAHH